MIYLLHVDKKIRLHALFYCLSMRRFHYLGEKLGSGNLPPEKPKISKFVAISGGQVAATAINTLARLAYILNFSPIKWK